MRVQVAIDAQQFENDWQKERARSPETVRDRAPRRAGRATLEDYACGFSACMAVASSPPASPVWPLGVSLSMSPGSKSANCEPAWSGEIPALAAKFLTVSLPSTWLIWSAEIGRFCAVETHDDTTSPRPFCWKFCTRPSSPPG